jgi:hypothetical protein
VTQQKNNEGDQVKYALWRLKILMNEKIKSGFGMREKVDLV